jgi:hypothetical protein
MIFFCSFNNVKEKRKIGKGLHDIYTAPNEAIGNLALCVKYKWMSLRRRKVYLSSLRGIYTLQCSLNYEKIMIPLNDFARVREFRIINKFILTLIIDQWRILWVSEREEKSKGIASSSSSVSFRVKVGGWIFSFKYELMIDHRKKFNRTSDSFLRQPIIFIKLNFKFFNGKF